MGAGGPGSIPGEALFKKKSKSKKKINIKKSIEKQKQELVVRKERNNESLPSSVGRACGF